MSLPTTQKGVLCTATTQTLVDVPVYKPEKGEVLVKNVCSASNPKDWKIPKYIPGYSAVEGSDNAGDVVAIGEGVTKFQVGDKVAGFCKCFSKENKNGAYQQYTIVPEITLFHIPENISYEDACTIPLAAMTSAMVLFDPKALGLPSPFEQAPTSNNDITVVINGASSSIGAYGVQLAKHANFRVIGIAGSGAEYAKQLGADVVVDYRNKSGDELAQELQTHGPFSYVYDCVSSVDTIKLLCKALQPKGGKIESVINVWEKENLEDVCNPTKNIRHHHSLAGNIHYNEIDGEFGARYTQYLSKAIKDGVLKPNKVRIMPKGLESVSDGFSLLENNKVSAEKLVYRVKDTPSLTAS